MNALHQVQFPAETSEYREKRNELLAAEVALKEQTARVAALRSKLPLGGKLKEDYEFERLDAEGNVVAVKLSELFENGKDSLILYSYMYSAEMANPCTACTSILDAAEGTVEHLRQRVNFAVIAKSPIHRIHALAEGRGWKKLPLLSSEKNTYNSDYFAESSTGAQMPACNVFVKRGEEIFHFYSTELLYVKREGHPRHVDMMWPLWNYFDLIPEGRGTNWFPKLEYDL